MSSAQRSAASNLQVIGQLVPPALVVAGIVLVALHWGWMVGLSALVVITLMYAMADAGDILPKWRLQSSPEKMPPAETTGVGAVLIPLPVAPEATAKKDEPSHEG